MTKNRVEAFSDGVFSIVITLLIFNLHLPANQILTWHVLAQISAPIFVFVMSFCIVGVYWVSHHTLWHFVSGVNRSLLWLNLLQLLMLVFLPFTASMIGQHLFFPMSMSLMHSRPGEAIAVTVYGVNLLLENILIQWMWIYCIRHPELLKPGLSQRAQRRGIWVNAIPIAGYTLAILLVPVWIPASIFLFVAVPIFFIVPNPWLRRYIGQALQEASTL